MVPRLVFYLSVYFVLFSFYLFCCIYFYFYLQTLFSREAWRGWRPVNTLTPFAMRGLANLKSMCSVNLYLSHTTTQHSTAQHSTHNTSQHNTTQHNTRYPFIEKVLMLSFLLVRWGWRLWAFLESVGWQRSHQDCRGSRNPDCSPSQAHQGTLQVTLSPTQHHTLPLTYFILIFFFLLKN